MRIYGWLVLANKKRPDGSLKKGSVRPEMRRHVVRVPVLWLEQQLDCELNAAVVSRSG
jgi:hypothetical protein